MTRPIVKFDPCDWPQIAWAGILDLYFEDALEGQYVLALVPLSSFEELEETHTVLYYWEES